MGWAMPENTVLGMFAKKPEPGRVKTRLAAELGESLAVEIADAMLRDALALWGSDRFVEGGRRVVVFDPPHAGPWFDEITPAALALQAQAEGDLGARMSAFFQGEFEDGAAKVIVVGTDSPTLDPNFVISAFLLLDQKDVVLAPAMDGGYVLVGCRRFVPQLFQDIAWSTPAVLDQTTRAIEACGATLALLPPWYDVDDTESWAMLTGHIRAMRAAGMPLNLPHLEAMLASPRPAAPSGWTSFAG